MIYLIGSLRNPEIPKLANKIREATGEEVFDDWYAAGPEADDRWRDYEKDRGHSFTDALQGHAAKNVYSFDRRHIDRCRAGVLLLPAGKSGHLELGYIIGRGRPSYILLDNDPERFDVMYQFATGVFSNQEDLITELRREKPQIVCKPFVGQVGGINQSTKSASAPREMWEDIKTCSRCITFSNDTIDRMIYHKNYHIWPGFAGEPDGGSFGGSDF